MKNCAGRSPPFISRTGRCVARSMAVTRSQGRTWWASAFPTTIAASLGHRSGPPVFDLLRQERGRGRYPHRARPGGQYRRRRHHQLGEFSDRRRASLGAPGPARLRRYLHNQDQHGWIELLLSDVFGGDYRSVVLGLTIDERIEKLEFLVRVKNLRHPGAHLSHRPVTSAENYAPSRRGTQRVVSFHRADIVSKLLRSQ